MLLILFSTSDLVSFPVTPANGIVNGLTSAAAHIVDSALVPPLLNQTLQARVPPLPQPAGLQNSPLFWGFEDQDHLNAAARALTDFWQLLLAARIAFYDCDVPPEQSPTFLRYFRAQDVDYVRKWFDWTSGPNYEGQPLLAQAVQIRWRYYTNDVFSPCDTLPIIALNRQGQVNGVWQSQIILCEPLFSSVYSQSIEAALSNNCQVILDRPTPKMMVPGSTILHELLEVNPEPAKI